MYSRRKWFEWESDFIHKGSEGECDKCQRGLKCPTTGRCLDTTLRRREVEVPDTSAVRSLLPFFGIF